MNSTRHFQVKFLNRSIFSFLFLSSLFQNPLCFGKLKNNNLKTIWTLHLGNFLSESGEEWGKAWDFLFPVLDKPVWRELSLLLQVWSEDVYSESCNKVSKVVDQIHRCIVSQVWDVEERQGHNSFESSKEEYLCDVIHILYLHNLWDFSMNPISPIAFFSCGSSHIPHYVNFPGFKFSFCKITEYIPIGHTIQTSF